MVAIVVAAISARLLAEAAARDGFDVIALDCYGDADTRRAALQWLPIGIAEAPQIDSQRVLDALGGLSQQHGGELIGWIPGSGFEGRPELLAAGAKLLPLIGTAAADVRRVRDPLQFFGALAAHGIAHPPTRALAPAEPEGWVSKDANACGGWHIRPAAQAPETVPMHACRYFQRPMAGIPMSATFLADGHKAQLLGFNDLIVRPFASRPYVYCGCVGPVTVPAGVAPQVTDAVRRLTAEFRLRGWCSLDFIRDGGAIGVLELNPRPPASMALYPPLGQIEAQLRACLHDELPPPGAFVPARVAGSRIVYARRRLQLGAGTLRQLADQPDVHDVPAAGAQFEPGDPLCSLTAEGAGAAQVQALLSARHDALLNTLHLGDMT